ncbi:bifunctional (p)ppGpp synthetase/guanosine-3',5'-bis(diphosphate) 3'-pyrophosphohydrolase [bacterium]|nr:bifunctional (p)ppGpp synthetase/guanosine-3',5'-bis(diphosphate) 3'-pyrophosphohydrolase [bacterium]
MPSLESKLEKLIKIIKKWDKDVNTEMVEKAFWFAEEKHRGQKRFSGEPYFNHVYETAKILAENKFSTKTIKAGLLHDTLEDTDATEEEIKNLFGEDTLFIVKGITKLGKIKYRNDERYAENLRKMFTNAAEDTRVMLVKFADRIHNLRTLGYHKNPEKRLRIARESLEIYARIANRLNMWHIQSELEDLSFKWIEPEEYRRMKKIIAKEKKKNKDFIDKTIKDITEILKKNKLKNFKVEGRVKNVYSLYKKLQRKNNDISKIYDILAFRIILDSEIDCYKALGIIHSINKPIPGRIKDYIANPKTNGYKSIHTTVFREKMITEIQITTHKMHDFNQYGLAAHPKYKEEELASEWFEYLKKINLASETSKEFLETIKLDVFSKDNIYALTPKGDAIELPKESTPIDFAYKVHTGLGNKCYQAIINGKIAPLDTKIENNDIVNIKTKSNAQPKQKWLEFVKTNIAKQSIRKWLKNNKKSENIIIGKEILVQKMKEIIGKEVKIEPKIKEKILKEVNRKDFDTVLEDIALSNIKAIDLIKIIEPKLFQNKKFIKQKEEENLKITINNIKNIKSSFAKCCEPKKGDEIIGYITSMGYIQIHKKDCKKIKNKPEYRLVDIDWE